MLSSPLGDASLPERRCAAAAIHAVGPPWTIEIGRGPVLATAIHNGHEVRPELLGWLAIAEEARWREEDPLTELFTQLGDSRVLVHRSRFEVDLNRPREDAVAVQAWGHRVWHDALPPELLAESLACHDGFYAAMRRCIARLLRRHRRLLVLDIHSYNHRRDGPAAPPADPAGYPDINVGTGTLADARRFRPLVRRFEAALREHDFGGRHLDVRENVCFKGGYFPLWLHRSFPGAVCTLSIECKKIFMDEWTFQADIPLVYALRRALREAVEAAREALRDLD